MTSRRFHLLVLFVVSFASFALAGNSGQYALPETGPQGALLWVNSTPSEGFSWPYYLFIPKRISEAKASHPRVKMLVIPNNTGNMSDDGDVHQDAAFQTLVRARTIAEELNIVVLVPIFPRPESDWTTYTHALDRSTLLSNDPNLRRIDLQLIRMIDDARKRESHEGITIEKRVLMFGFSASAMFTNRFVFLHPDRVRAAAFGSPGGWAIAPVSTYKGQTLRYPIGVADLRQVSGKKLNLKAVVKVPQFLFMGDADENDSVVYRDSYDEEDQDVIFKTFGPTLISRWPYTEELYRRYLPNVELKLYPNVKHQVTKEIQNDILAFFKKHLS